MKLSRNTTVVLKNFATINSNLVVPEGKTISTISAAKDIMGFFESEDEFDNELAIFNLNEFLGVLSAFTEPEIELDTKFATITQDKAKVNYLYADKSHLNYPQKKLTFPDADITFTLSNDVLSKLQKMAAILSVEDLAIVSEDNKIILRVYDKKSPSANSFEIDTDVETEDSFNIDFKIDKLKLLPGSYTVDISSKKISRFTHAYLDLVYYCAIEATSSYKKS